MIEPLTDLPDGVIGFVARGELDAEDYRSVLLPAIDRTVADDRYIRMVFVFEEWKGVSGGGMWEDLKMGVEHLGRWKRFALVTDLDWMVHVAHVFGWMTPGEMKRFALADRDAAVAWAAGS
jgi:hypothetical protein